MLAVAGLWSDRRGPIPTLRTGAIAFTLAQLLVGTATAMPMVVAGRRHGLELVEPVGAHARPVRRRQLRPQQQLGPDGGHHEHPTALAVSGTLLAALLTAGRVRRVDSV